MCIRDSDLTGDIINILLVCKPKIVLTHNLADRHETHVSTALRTIFALRNIPDDVKPEKVYAMEVWRSLDWLNDEDKLIFDTVMHPNIANAVLGVFDSQICGGKRYDLAAIGRRRANATFLASHGVDRVEAVSYTHLCLTSRKRLALQSSAQGLSLIHISGGLGPTYDDLTKETVAEYFHKAMQMDEESLLSIETFFKKIDRPMTENNKKQAMMPVGATIFPNAHGTAPGLAVSENGKTAILLPGPPSEMKPMFDESVVPYLMGFSDKVLVSHNLRLFGVGESQVEDILYDLMKNSTNPTIAPYAKTAEVTPVSYTHLDVYKRQDQGSRRTSRL